MSTTITSHTLACGMPLVIESSTSVQSLALNWLLPAGSATDPADAVGLSTLLAELLTRGAGDLDGRQHSDALDMLGVQRSAYAGRHHMHIGATLLADRLAEALPLIVSMVRAPRLAAESLDGVRALCLQSFESLRDEPQHMVGINVNAAHEPPPFNRSGYGDRATLESATLEQIRAFWQQRFVPVGAILAVAGAVDPEQLINLLNTQLAGWSGDVDEPQPTAEPQGGIAHEQQDSNQSHIAICCDAPAEPHEDSMLERLAVGVLSGGTSARLFTEVRQKRSLCYSVGASYRAGRDRGVVRLYAGTRPERAQETIDVSLAEFDRIAQGATDEEYRRAVTQLKSHLIMSGESSRARASAIASDQFRLGHARSLDEIARRVDAISHDDLNAYLARRSFGPFTMATIGPAALSLPVPA